MPVPSARVSYFSATGCVSPTRRWLQPRNTTKRAAPRPSASACRSRDWRRAATRCRPPWSMRELPTPHSRAIILRFGRRPSPPHQRHSLLRLLHLTIDRGSVRQYPAYCVLVERFQRRKKRAVSPPPHATERQDVASLETRIAARMFPRTFRAWQIPAFLRPPIGDRGLE